MLNTSSGSLSADRPPASVTATAGPRRWSGRSEPGKSRRGAFRLLVLLL